MPILKKIKKLNNAAGVLSGDLFVCGLVIKKEDLAKLLGVNDSKKLTEKKRERLFIEIKEKALAWSIAEASHTEIDELNILQATFLAMKRAVDGLNIQPHKVIVDGNQTVFKLFFCIIKC